MGSRKLFKDKSYEEYDAQDLQLLLLKKGEERRNRRVVNSIEWGNSYIAYLITIDSTRENWNELVELEEYLESDKEYVESLEEKRMNKRMEKQEQIEDNKKKRFKRIAKESLEERKERLAEEKEQEFTNWELELMKQQDRKEGKV
jgi:hypothetical protein